MDRGKSRSIVQDTGKQAGVRIITSVLSLSLLAVLGSCPAMKTLFHFLQCFALQSLRKKRDVAVSYSLWPDCDCQIV